MIAIAIMSMALVGAVGANYMAQYWAITSQTSNEALYKAKTKLEDLRSLVRQDFYQATSSPLVRSIDSTDPNDAACRAGGLCYYIQTTITDLSSCSKYVQAIVSWQVRGYATTTTSLFTNLTNADEAVALGGDCILNQPVGNWASPTASTTRTSDFSSGILTGVDVLDGLVLTTGDEAPFLTISRPKAPSGYDNDSCTDCVGAFNAVDAARDEATGKTYAYVAATSSQLQIVSVDETGTVSPYVVGASSLAGVTPGPESQGWRIAFYDRKVYVTTRFIAGLQPEFHVFDVGIPAFPLEVGSGVNLDTSVYDIVVRDQHSNGAPCLARPAPDTGICRFAYLATTLDSGEVRVLDVTDPTSIPPPVAEVNLPDDPGCVNQPDAKSLELAGNSLYVGRASSPVACPSVPELYVLDVTDPYDGITIESQKEVGASVWSLRVSGKYLFMGTNKSGSQVQIWNADPANLTSAGGNFSIPTLAETSIDLGGDLLYTISQTSPRLRTLYAP